MGIIECEVGCRISFAFLFFTALIFNNVLQDLKANLMFILF